jgi:hypothetical protein
MFNSAELQAPPPLLPFSFSISISAAHIAE